MHPGRVRDLKTAKAKNALAPEWVQEILTDAVKKRTPNKTVVIDLFAGWQSLAPICQQFGLDYIAVDINGARS